MQVGDLVVGSEKGHPSRLGNAGIVIATHDHAGIGEIVSYCTVVFDNKTLKLKNDQLEVISASR